MWLSAVGGTVLLLLAAVLFYTFLARHKQDVSEEAAGETPDILLTDVTAAAGIAFAHEAGARGEMLNPETFGPGAGWFDFDGDGRPDLLLVNGNLLRGAADPAALSALYRNLGGGRFEDVTARAGIAIPFYGMGFVSADVDNDGDQDLLLYGLHRSIFFLNQGGGSFREATAASGLTSLDGWVGAAAFFDYDRDGYLDLFIGNYVDWSPEKEDDVDCTFGSGRKKYCPVAMFPPSAPQLFRGRGDGTFQETTLEAGFSKLQGKALGVAVEDYDRDGHPDLFVANDSVPNFLLRNRGDGTFEERGIESGFATDADGAALAGMGIDTAWAPNDGPLLLAIGNFSGEPTTLHVQEDLHYFIESSLSSGLGGPTLDRVTFGLLFEDLDLDGDQDLVLANGHVFDVESITSVPYRQLTQVFLRGDGWKFEEARAAEQAHILNRPLIGRALAAADYDGDGDLDLVLSENQGKAVLLRNDHSGPRRTIRVELRGSRSNRDAIGAEVTLRSRRSGAPWSARRTRKAASSYLSQSERQITFVLHPGEVFREIEVCWPSGLREAYHDVEEGRETLLVEGTGRAVSEKGPPAASTGSPEASNPVVLRQRGVKLLEAGQTGEALRFFERAAQGDPHDFAAQRFRLIALWRLGRRRDVDEKVREVVKLFPNASLLVGHFALVLRETGYVELARKLFLEAVRLEPRRADAWMALANIEFDRKQHDSALRFYEKALAINPGSVEALANIGKIHTLRKEYDVAEKFLGKALALQPDSATALGTLGAVMLAREKYDLAERHLTRAREGARGKRIQLEIYGNLGILYYKRRDRHRAIECFEKVLELDPSDAQAKKVLERLRR